MEKIVIEVGKVTARNWQNVPAGLRRRLEESFETQIEILIESMKIAEFKALRSELSTEAQKNGLTEEILEKLLNVK